MEIVTLIWWVKRSDFYVQIYQRRFQKDVNEPAYAGSLGVTISRASNLTLFFQKTRKLLGFWWSKAVPQRQSFRGVILKISYYKSFSRIMEQHLRLNNFLIKLQTYNSGQNIWSWKIKENRRNIKLWYLVLSKFWPLLPKFLF